MLAWSSPLRCPASRNYLRHQSGVSQVNNASPSFSAHATSRLRAVLDIECPVTDHPARPGTSFFRFSLDCALQPSYDTVLVGTKHRLSAGRAVTLPMKPVNTHRRAEFEWGWRTNDDSANRRSIGALKDVAAPRQFFGYPRHILQKTRAESLAVLLRYAAPVSKSTGQDSDLSLEKR